MLPIVTRGPAENVEALLYLKGVDAAIINSDALEQFKALVPNIRQRITYILSLFPSELHIFVRPEIKSLNDLKGKKVNFNTAGTAAAYSGPLIFEQLKLDVEKTFIPHQVALEQMRTGQGGMEAVVFVTSKPIDAFQHRKWDPGFKFLAVPFEDFSFYLPSTLTANDYPDLIPQGQQVETIAIPTILAAFNWQKGSDRYKRVARLTDYLFSRFEKLQGSGFSPQMEGCQPQCEGTRARPLPGSAGVARQCQFVPAGSDPPRLCWQQRFCTTRDPPSPEQRRLFQEFLDWRRKQGK